MNLSAYPRPPGDTGLGIHWSAGPPAAVPLEEVRQRWLPELLAMNIKWVKCLHDGAEGLAEELLANDIMPIVRLYRPQPNPGRLDDELKERVKRLRSVGVVYFEINNEPNLKEEWQSGAWDAAGVTIPDVVVEHWIADAEFILEQGGLPAFPALSPGGHWDDVDFLTRALAAVAARDRADLFCPGNASEEAGAWLAVHNYFLNHPVDYPYDDVNQLGRPVSPSEARHEFPVPLDEANRQRRLGRAPGRTLREDSNGFLKYRRYHNIFVEQFGFEVPILGTEGGAVMRRAQDPRYPIVDAELHRERNLFGFTHMADAPAYYFCNCPWLIANEQMNHSNPAWEENAWYSDVWSNGRLPVVQAVKGRAPWPTREMSLQPRLGGAGESALTVEVTDGAGHVAVVRRVPSDAFVADAEIDETERVALANLRPGTYRVEIVGTNTDLTPVSLAEGETITVTAQVPPKQSVIAGRIVNPPKDTYVTLLQLTNAGTDRTLRRIRITDSAESTFTFDRLWAGRYRVQLDIGQDRQQGQSPLVASDPIEVDGRNREEVTLTVPPRHWRFAVEENTSGSDPTDNRRSVVHVIAPGLHGQLIRLHAPWAVITEHVGNKPEVNPEAAVIDSLPAGPYRITAPDVPGDVEFFLDGRGMARIRLAKVEAPAGGPAGGDDPVPSAAQGRIRCRLLLPDGDTSPLPVDVELLQTGDVVARTQTDAEGVFVFSSLAAGAYVVRVPAFSLESTPIELDAEQELALQLRVPAEADTPDGPMESPAAALQTYVWLVPGQLDLVSVYMVTLPLMLETGWAFGFSAIGAQHAGEVLVIGGARPDARVRAGIPIRTEIVAEDPLLLAAEIAAVPEGESAGSEVATSPSETTHLLPSYILVGDPQGAQTRALLVMLANARLLDQWGPNGMIGFHIEEARHAKRVLILANDDEISPAEEESLRSDDRVVRRAYPERWEAVRETLTSFLQIP